MNVRRKNGTVVRDVMLVGTLGTVFVVMCSLFLIRNSRLSNLQATVSTGMAELEAIKGQISPLQKELKAILSEKNWLLRQEKRLEKEILAEARKLEMDHMFEKGEEKNEEDEDNAHEYDEDEEESDY
uniref:Uncharacterized protein n=1 Tax=Rhodosorus marinus TaxID=101924 RepID=A0A7S2ZKZ4_9RHOD|mmetsp:Transcript_21731/g.88590  ORF Transcript_21731/g.88590 Transcript_21731/m.88590 type:complete len:127 (+) Transcript_21731:226-606(+)